ncbi:MAG: endopeptidase La [Thermodesulfobacteriota bacterium]
MSKDNEITGAELTAYPMMPLRDIVLFPYMVAPLVVGRDKSIKALEDAMAGNKIIFLVTQTDSGVDEPDFDNLYRMGTVASVLQLLRLPDGTIKALVEGKRRGRINKYHSGDNFASVEIEELEDSLDDEKLAAAYIREIAEKVEKYYKKYKKLNKEVVTSLRKTSNPVKFIDFLSSHLPIETQEKQKILETTDFYSRMELVLSILHKETEIALLEQRIHGQVKKKMEKTQKDYYLAEQMKVIRKEMGEDDTVSELDDLWEQINKKKLPAAAKDKLNKEFNKLKKMQPMSAEATVVRNYIDTILSLPWYSRSRKKLDIKRAEQILDEDHFGLHKPKERILEYLAVQSQVKKIKGPILCLVGPPGVGKTSLSKSLARAMGRKFVRQSLGGVRDEAEIRGHRRTYIGAMPGKIIQSLQKVKVNNPVFCLDEIDKMSQDFRGDPSSALLEVLDPEQNNGFNDHYLDLDYDLSDILFVTTANNLTTIPHPLRDRMEIIHLTGYTEEDKLQIAKKFLVPKQLKANGFAEKDIIFTNGAIFEINRSYTREAGVRHLEGNIASICRKIARNRVTGKKNKRYRVLEGTVNKYLGVAKYRFGRAEEQNEIGLATGLAWTEVGGELLQIETVLMPGSGKLNITGKLGDIMQESAQAALSYVRTRAARLGLAPDFYQKIDIHVHVPEGAIPKDGPSAGITMAVSMISALLKKPVRKDIALTGEITLRGRVLPIGGLTEKLLAARRGNIKHVLIPAENERDLKELSGKILKSLEIDCINHMDNVLEKALALADDEKLFHKSTDETFCLDLTTIQGNTDNLPAH